MITALPTPPSREDAGNFAARGDAFLGALPRFALEANALAAAVNDSVDAATAAATSAVNAPGTNATSATSLTVGTGSKMLAIQPGKALVAGQFVTIAAAADPANWMVGWISNHDDETGALTVWVMVSNGVGTFTSWVIGLSAPLRFAAATAAQIFIGLSNVVGVTPASLRAAMTPVAVPFAASITLDGTTFINADIGDLTGNFSLPSPVNMAPGMNGRIRFRQDATGNRTGSFGAAWDFAGGLVPTFSTPAGAVDELHYFVNSPTSISAFLRKAVA